MCKKDRIKDLAELDQSISECINTFPVMWYGLYEGCVEKGFTKEQAIDLVKTFILKE